MTTRAVLIAITLGGGLPAPSIAQGPADSAAVRLVILDYAEGYYAGDVGKVARALHPDFAKRVVFSKPGRPSVLREMRYEDFVEITLQGGGSGTPSHRRLRRVSLLDLYENAATAKLVTAEWVEYLHLARWQGRWVVLNALWELTPPRR